MARNMSANALMAGWQNESPVAAMENIVMDRQKRFLGDFFRHLACQCFKQHSKPSSPGTFEDSREVAPRTEQAQRGHKHPQYGELIQQLAEQA